MVLTHLQKLPKNVRDLDKLFPKALTSCPKSKKLPNLVTLPTSQLMRSVLTDCNKLSVHNSFSYSMALSLISLTVITISTLPWSIFSTLMVGIPGFAPSDRTTAFLNVPILFCAMQVYTPNNASCVTSIWRHFSE